MPADPSANAGFMWAAYAAAAVILLGYGLLLWRRARRLVSDRVIAASTMSAARDDRRTAPAARRGLSRERA